MHLGVIKLGVRDDLSDEAGFYTQKVDFFSTDD